MITRNRAIALFFALAVLAGCASTNVTQQTSVASPQFARPNQIWVYDFIADPARIPADSPLRDDLSAPSTPLTSEEVESGRRLSAIITKSVVADIQAMGLSVPYQLFLVMPYGLALVALAGGKPRLAS